MKYQTLIGQVIGGCRVEALLGKGGMGHVFLAHHLNLDIQIALKLLNISATTPPELIERFILEARSAAKLDSPNIVRVMQVGEDQGFYYIQMEYVEGESLASYLKRLSPLGINKSLYFLRQIIRGLHDAHEKGIIHRDIKPDNILINRKGVLKIADFGLVKLAKEEDNNLTATGQVLGTPYYIAPEQCEGKEVDGRSDLYSLGIVMYYMLTKHLPFTGDSSLIIVVSRLQKDPPSMNEYRQDIPQGVQNLVMKMMERNPENRHQNAEELLDEIEDLIEKLARGYRYRASELNIKVAEIQRLLSSPAQKELSSAKTIVSLPGGSSQNLQTIENFSPLVQSAAETMIEASPAANVSSTKTDYKLETENPIPKVAPVEEPTPEHTSAPITPTAKSFSVFGALFEILLAVMIAFGVLQGVRKKQKNAYTHIYSVKTEKQYGYTHGKIANDFSETVVVVADQAANVALQSTQTFLQQYRHTPYADFVKELVKSVAFKQEILQRITRNFNKRTLEFENGMYPPPLVDKFLYSKKNELSTFARVMHEELKEKSFLPFKQDVDLLLVEYGKRLEEIAEKKKAMIKEKAIVEEKVDTLKKAIAKMDSDFAEFRERMYRIMQHTRQRLENSRSLESIDQILKDSHQEAKVHFENAQKKLRSLEPPRDIYKKISRAMGDLIKTFLYETQQLAEQTRKRLEKNNENRKEQRRRQLVDNFFRSAKKSISGIRLPFIRNPLQKRLQNIQKRIENGKNIDKELRRFAGNNRELRRHVEKLLMELKEIDKE